MKCVYVYNKIDVVGIDDVDKLARQPNSVVISCNLKVCSIISVATEFEWRLLCLLFDTLLDLLTRLAFSHLKIFL